MKTYSFRVYARLAFSVAMSLDPEILLLDEVMAVGDASFAERACKPCRTFLIVHDDRFRVPQSQQCRSDRAIWLDRGEIRAEGDASEGVEANRKSVKPAKAE